METVGPYLFEVHDALVDGVDGSDPRFGLWAGVHIHNAGVGDNPYGTGLHDRGTSTLDIDRSRCRADSDRGGSGADAATSR
jgi:hypothetical protein